MLVALPVSPYYLSTLNISIYLSNYFSNVCLPYKMVKFIRAGLESPTPKSAWQVTHWMDSLQVAGPHLGGCRDPPGSYPYGFPEVGTSLCSPGL